MTETNAEPETRPGGHRKALRPRKRHRRTIFVTVAILALIAIGTTLILNHTSARRAAGAGGTVPYLGVFEPDAPESFADIDQLAHAIGRQPNLVSYYSHWLEPFQSGFATSAEDRGDTAVVQIAPGNYSLKSIASGRYDSYLRSYAGAVKAFGAHLILSFGHEMNGSWYSWGYRHASPRAFVAAWRHIVTVFRAQGARNLTWLWTVNIIGKPNLIPAPGPWWPGKAYVNWVGIDGYFWYKAAEFNTVFAPTIVYVRQLTHDPILIAETGAEPAVGQASKINDLFGGARTFGLLGFIWFDDDSVSAAKPGEALNWRLTPAALATLGQDARTFLKRSRSP
jgi:mannan endo-1,4-beta-mannosidase